MRVTATTKTKRWLGGLWLAVVLSLIGIAQAFAQAAPWQTAPGGDAAGDYVRVELAEREGVLRGMRRVERIEAPSGYRTGTALRIVFDGAEPEAQRMMRVHIPYGASLDLAVGERVEVNATSRRRGLGTLQEVLVTRRGAIVVLTTARDGIAGIRVERGAEAPSDVSRRRWGLRLRVAGTDIETTPGRLFYVAPASLLVMGTEHAYVGTRPPDAFDQRVLTIVRIRPPA